jgi:hypothetical protein
VDVFAGGGLLGAEGVLSDWQPAMKMPVPAKIVINSRARNFIMRLMEHRQSLMIVILKRLIFGPF